VVEAVPLTHRLHVAFEHSLLLAHASLQLAARSSHRHAYHTTHTRQIERVSK